jgi:D-sedoheptulose 7-phosphate isomerase
MEKKKIMLVGNGGSAAIAEHIAIDFTKNAGVRAIAISGSPMITTLSNDRGFDKLFQNWIEAFANARDVLIAVSSSGESQNIHNKEARKKDMYVVTFSSFSPANPLRKMGDVNFWVNSKSYGYVEIVHNLLLHCLNDMIIGNAFYSA